MKKAVLYIIALLFFAAPAMAQGPAIITEELCWEISDTQDSTIVGYYLYTSRGTEPKLMNYLDAGGAPVTITGGTVRVGACKEQIDVGAQQLVFVYNLDEGENYTLPADTLEKYNFLFFYMESVPGPPVDTTVVLLPEVANVGSRYLGKNLYFYGGGDAAQVNTSAPCVIRTPDPGDDPGSDSDILRTDCDTIGTISRWDTLFTAETDQRFVRYSTVPTGEFMSYLRECEKAFNSNRAILRVPQPGDNIGGSTVQDFLNFFYFAPPTISLAQSPSTSTIEIGTTQQYTFTATTTNTGGATLSGGSLFVVAGGEELDDYGAGTTGSATIDFTPLQTPVDTFDSATYQFRASQGWVSGAESGTATSNTRTLRAVYPVLYGMVADTATAFADPYGELTKLVQAEGDKTVSYTGTGLIFYGFPQTWSDTNLSSIIDPNGFNVTASFTRVTYPVVTSTGLVNNYTSVPYVFYFLNTGSTTTSASNYTFNQ